MALLSRIFPRLKVGFLNFVTQLTVLEIYTKFFYFKVNSSILNYQVIIFFLDWLQRYHAVAVEFNWLLEVIGRNRLVPFVDHEFAEIPSELLRRFNFSDEMLESEIENTD